MMLLLNCATAFEIIISSLPHLAGERLIQYASENLVTEVLIHPQTNTFIQCMRNLLSSFTRHRHIIHAGYTFTGNGSWILQVRPKWFIIKFAYNKPSSWCPIFIFIFLARMERFPFSISAMNSYRTTFSACWGLTPIPFPLTFTALNWVTGPRCRTKTSLSFVKFASIRSTSSTAAMKN